MLIGTNQIDYTEIYKRANTPEDLVLYVESLVPIWANHIQAIVYNQRYYTAVIIRNMLQIPYKTREACTNALLEGISINGVMNGFIPITDIIDHCNKDALIAAITEGAKYGTATTII